MESFDLLKRSPSNKGYLCEICDKHFRDKNHYRYHLAVELDIKPNVCNFCGQAFRVDFRLKKHIKTKHPEHFVAWSKAKGKNFLPQRSHPSQSGSSASSSQKTLKNDLVGQGSLKSSSISSTSLFENSLLPSLAQLSQVAAASVSTNNSHSHCHNHSHSQNKSQNHSCSQNTSKYENTASGSTTSAVPKNSSKASSKSSSAGLQSSAFSAFSLLGQLESGTVDPPESRRLSSGKTRRTRSPESAKLEGPLSSRKGRSPSQDQELSVKQMLEKSQKHL